MSTAPIPPEEDNRLDLSRRDFVRVLGAGLLITVTSGSALAQRGERGPQKTIISRVHIGQDGVVTVLTGKIEAGQGARTEITQAAAEELRLPVERVRLLMGDTAAVPDDGGTYGSRTTGANLPDIRRGAASAREVLAGLAAARLNVPKESITLKDGAFVDSASGRSVSYGELAGTDYEQAANVPANADVQLTPVTEWRVMGTPVPKIDARDIVTGTHRYPSDIVRPNMLYGKVLRSPSFEATLESLDPAEAQAMDGVKVVRDGDFVGCVAPTSWRAAKAVEALAKTAKWKEKPQISNKDLFAHLKQNANYIQARGDAPDAVKDALAKSAKTFKATYEVAYIQHVPMEPRAAVAEWEGDSVTVWTGSQVPFGVHGDVAEALSLPREKVRVIMPDMGGGFGGKHTGETAVEAARLAKGAGKPVHLRWTRAEEFMWAYFRPAGLFEVHAGLDGSGKIVAWDFTNINSGPAALKTAYDIPAKGERFVTSDPPLRQGSYRALAATANHFARESFMDELAHEAGADPLAFRLAHISEPRLRAVVEAAAKQFGWAGHAAAPNTGIGLACGTEKGSFVATCAEVEADPKAKTIKVKRVCEAFECGAIINPPNLRQQIEGCIVMGLGGALIEEVLFENGKLLNGSLSEYPVPRFKDLPPIELVMLDRRDLPSVGAGETPIVGIAPAIANAVFNATGVRIRSMPIRFPEA